jgi:hypothetical protein
MIDISASPQDLDPLVMVIRMGASWHGIPMLIVNSAASLIDSNRNAQSLARIDVIWILQ